MTSPHDLAESLVLLARLAILALNLPSIARFQQFVGLKLNAGRMDMRIATIVLEHQVVLITRNVRDFARVPGLLLADWTQ
jgi:tRNA(fMet)-specific endonuclease VapC